MNSNPIILRSSGEISLFKGPTRGASCNKCFPVYCHAWTFLQLCTCPASFFLPISKSFNTPLRKKMFSLSGSSWYINEGGQGGLVKGFTINSFAFQKSQNKIIVIIDLWSLPPVCSYKFLREASCRCAWVQWSMFSYIKRLKNEVKIKYQVVVTVVWTKWWFNLFNWSLMYFLNWSLYFVNSA